MRKYNQTKQAIISIFFITLILMVTGSTFPSPAVGLNRWSMCHWGITYETGFIYRGLIGTICTSILGMMTVKKIYFISLFLLIILYFLFSFVFIKIYRKNASVYSFLLILFVACLPSNIRWWSIDEMFARLDMFIAIIAFISCILIVRIKRKGILLAVLLALSLIALLIHEGFGLLFASGLFALLLYRFNKDEDKLVLTPLFVYYLPLMVAFLIVILIGGRDVSVESLSLIFEKNVSADFSDAMPVVVRQVIADSFSRKMEEVKNIQTVRTTLSMILTYVVMLPPLALFAGIFARMIKVVVEKKKKILIIIVIGSCFAPIFASFIAYDQFRWIGYFFICLSMTVISLFFMEDNFSDAIIEFVKKNKFYFIAVIIFCVLMGVLHDMYGIGYVETLVSRLYY